MRIFQRIQTRLRWSKRHYFILIFCIILISYVASTIYHTVKALPEGLDLTGPIRSSQVEFIADTTRVDAQGVLQTEQHIFNRMLAMVQQSKTTIVLDMFLLNDQFGQSKPPQQRLAQELVQALVAKKRSNPQMSISVIVDPMNSLYGSIQPDDYVQLRRVGIDLVETNLIPLRSSNPTWSGFWYLCCQGITQQSGDGWLPNPLSSDKITLRSYFSFLNFKTNHRKTMVVDTDHGWQALVGSKNPNSGGVQQSNAALMVHGAAAVDVLNSEQTVARMSGVDLPYVVMAAEPKPTKTDHLQSQVLTEQAIERAIINMLSTAQRDDEINLVAFYLSDREVIDALKLAHQRGVKLKILLNPNQESVARYKNGFPNQPVASELHDAGITVRWCEHCHSKMIYKRFADGRRAELVLGSANLTARNLNNYNLETDIRVFGLASESVFKDTENYFNQMWLGQGQVQGSADYEVYANRSSLKYWLYRFMEWSGICSF